MAYIIRKDSEESDCDDQLEQMIERAPHTITEANGTIIKYPTFVTDNKMFFDKLADIKPHARARNGREAYMAFKHKLISATYRGEGRCYNFETYATLHKEHHAILEVLKRLLICRDG